MVLDFKHASIPEGVRFTAQVGVPNVVQGLFRKRQKVVAVAGLMQADQLAYGCTASLVKKYGPEPFWVRLVTEEALLVHQPDDIRRVLEGSPSPFASDPDAKRKGMCAFQPNALTISRGDLWASRRRFAEAVLDNGRPVHRLGGHLARVAVAEADGLLELGRPITWCDVNDAFQRLTRKVVLGADAAGDTALSELLGGLMDAGNKLPGTPADGYEEFHAGLQRYLDVADPEALAGLVDAAPHATDEDTDPAGQMIHWLFALGDTLPANLLRTLAVLSCHPLQLAQVRAELAERPLAAAQSVAETTYLRGCILDTMRLWPTAALFGRVTTEDVRFPHGEVVREGSQVLIHNLFNHRNRARIPYADRFAPEEWVDGGAADDWSFNFFSNGPQRCPGDGLAIFLGQAFLGRLLTRAEPVISSGPHPRPGKPLPYSLDINALEIDLEAR